jgi:DUF1680 family protein
MKASRRQFLQSSAIAAGSAAILRSPAWSSPSAQVAFTPKLSVLDYPQVQLLDGPLRVQFDRNHDLFLHLNEDAMLKPFRHRLGKPAPGPDMGGWYDDADDFNPPENFHAFIPGHSFGQYLSGLARAYAVTGSKPTQEKVHRLVRAFGETVEPSGKFYVGYHLPAYTYDKTSCGLIDAHEFAKCPDALDVHWRATQAALPHLPERALSRVEQRARPHQMVADTWDETYTLPENFLLAYLRSGKSEYSDLAKRFIEEDYFGPLADGQNVLPGEHAYSHVNALSSAMQSYLVFGDEKYLRAATNGFRFVHEQSFATGGWGPDEAFVEPGKGLLDASLGTTHASFETPCGAYGHFKITRNLLRVTGDSRYGDSMERMLYNTIAGATPILADGTSFYYSDYNREGRKVHYRDKWPCCSGTFPQLTADYGISSYYKSDDGIPETFTLRLRIPAWAGAKTVVSVNDKKVDTPVEPGKFLALQRSWKDGDRIALELEMTSRLEAIDEQNSNHVALVRGPLAMFAVGFIPQKITRKQLLSATPVAQSSDDWVAETDTGTLTLRPFAAIMSESYRLYHRVIA